MVAAMLLEATATPAAATELRLVLTPSSAMPTPEDEARQAEIITTALDWVLGFSHDRLPQGRHFTPYGNVVRTTDKASLCAALDAVTCNSPEVQRRISLIRPTL